MSVLSFFRRPSHPPIRMIAADALVSALENGSLTLIDVRTHREWLETGRPEGSIGITLRDKAFETKVAHALGGDLTKPVCFSCLHGGRSMEAAQKAQKAGFTNIHSLEGGFVAWQGSGLAIESVE